MSVNAVLKEKNNLVYGYWLISKEISTSTLLHSYDIRSCLPLTLLGKNQNRIQPTNGFISTQLILNFGFLFNSVDLSRNLLHAASLVITLAAWFLKMVGGVRCEINIY